MTAPVRRGPRSFAPVDAEAALGILGSSAGVEEDREVMAAIAALVGHEPPALRWAGSLARTTGWRPLRERLGGWASLPGLLRAARLPWHREVEAARALLSEPDAALLARLAGCDAPFAWDVLDAVEPEVSIESICLLEDVGLLERRTGAGVVTFVVPYCVRAVHRLADPATTEGSAARWLGAWLARAEELRAASYGVGARAALHELASAAPLAERALLGDGGREGDAAVPPSRAQDLGLALWTRVSDAFFFDRAIDFASPAFARAVVVADGSGALEPRIRARLAAGRALLERGSTEAARASMVQAVALADEAAHDGLRAEALRGSGWADLAGASLAGARASFAAARALAETAGDPRAQADATAGLGIAALLEGDVATARALLAEALATHVVTRDAPREAAVRGMIALLPEPPEVPQRAHNAGPSPDVEALVRQVEALRASGQRWREALTLARLALAARARGDADAEALHLREARAAAALSSMSAAKLVATLVDARSAGGAGAGAIAGAGAEARPPMVVGFEGRSLRLPSGESHDLARHGALRRILWALAQAKVRTPGAALGTLALVDVGWPDEKMKHEAATLRVYTTIRRLRAMGLGSALVTRDDGYLLDPEIVLALQPA